MNATLHLTSTQAWVLLIALALLSWTLTEHGGAARLATTAVVLIGATKVRLVVTHFMELQPGHMPWRRAFDVWVVVVSAIILGGYWLA
jgi:hypothetical protein